MAPSSSQPALPVSECLPDILAALAESVPVVLRAPPGAGKTTGVPPALISAGLAGDGQVLLIQPRRLAARTAAHRLARLMDARLGDQVGYHVRFDKQCTDRTKLIAMTTGVLLRRLHSDPLLQDVSCVLLDEFHERSLEVDLALGMLHRIRTTLRPELKLLVMSATLDPQPIVDFLGDARAVTSEGRSFPVQVRYADTASNAFVDQQIVAALPGVWKSTPGHVLVFLPGVGEIRRTARAIESMPLARSAAIHCLYGDLPPADQDRVMAPSDVRKIILATNVAETSITIPGVTGVIDSGLARVLRYDAKVGLPKLQLEPISQASADQRSGRAGRTEAGVCHRLWTAASHRSRRQRDTPEIQRCDFSDALLTLAAWGERDVLQFPWLTPPPVDAIDTARGLLLRLDAIDAAGSLTPLGRQMLQLPLHPRLSRFMLAAADGGMISESALAAALLTERDPFRGDQPVAAKTVTGCDVADRVDRFHHYLAGDRNAVANPAAAKAVQRVAAQIERTTAAIGNTANDSGPVEAPNAQRLSRALLLAYPDRVARRRSPGSDRGVMVGGRGVRLAASSSARSGEFFLCIDVDSQGTEATVRAASVIDPQWLDPRLIHQVDEPFYNPTAKAVVVRRRRYFDDLMLSESPVECKPGPEVAELLYQQTRHNLDQLWPAKETAVRDWTERVRFLNIQMPQLQLPVLDDAALLDVLHQLCQSRTSIAQLRSAAWLDHLRGRYDYAQLQLIDRHAPARMTLPNGNTVAVVYAADKPPVIEVRIQEVFGWKKTPRVAGGKVSVLLHLLGPNYRPQQITDDLENFWRETYHHVRKELKRRYPKHHWPDNPADAQATRGGLKPRG